jgi:transposase-like protein
MVSWLRYRHRIPPPQLKRPEELTVQQIARKFGVSPHVVYYWIERGVIAARRINGGSPWWVTIDPEKERELRQWVENSTRIQKIRRQQCQSRL